MHLKMNKRMLRITAIIALSSISLMLKAQDNRNSSTPDWENEELKSFIILDPLASVFAIGSTQAANTNQRSTAVYFICLVGVWALNWLENTISKPVSFFMVVFDL